MLSRLFSGYSMRNIARESVLSSQSVLNLKKDFVETAKRVDIVQAARKYNVEKQVRTRLLTPS